MWRYLFSCIPFLILSSCQIQKIACILFSQFPEHVLLLGILALKETCFTLWLPCGTEDYHEIMRPLENNSPNDTYLWSPTSHHSLYSIPLICFGTKDTAWFRVFFWTLYNHPLLILNCQKCCKAWKKYSDLYQDSDQEISPVTVINQILISPHYYICRY